MTEISLETVIIFLLITVNGLLAMSELAIVSSRRVCLQVKAPPSTGRVLCWQSIQSFGL
jgi:CBS domain containing-hemolysin-like protein